MSPTAWQFPGQGSQTVGMGRDVYDAEPQARALFERAESVTGLPIIRLSFEGPAEELQQTQFAQPCLFTVCAALMAPLQQAGIRPAYVAGHSVGEYAAIYAAGMLAFGDALRLVARRGALMQAMRSGTMAAILGLDDDAVRRVCAEAAHTGVVVAANFNNPGQVVISGEPEAVLCASALAKKGGASRVVPLNVSGAFHSPLMAPASRDLAREIEATPMTTSVIPVISNVDATPTTEPDEVKEKLIRQLSSPVRWSDGIRAMQRLGVVRFCEIGPGRALTGILRQIDRTTTGVALGSLAAIRQEIETAKG